MPQSVLEVPQLTGQNRNMVYGQREDKPLMPYRVFNLVPDRQGGYVPFGRRVRLESDATPVALTHISRIIDYDESGISSYRTTAATNGKFQLFKGAETFAQQVSTDYPSIVDAVHIDNAGAYMSRDAFLVFDRQDRVMEPISISTAIEAEALPGTTVMQITGIGNINDIEHNGGTFIFVTSQGHIQRSTNEGTTWSGITQFSGANMSSVIYANGRWLASARNGTAYYSDDDGLSWTQQNINGGGLLVTSVVHVNGNILLASGAKIWRSTDLGDSWTEIDNLTGVSRTYEVQRLAVDKSRNGIPFSILGPCSVNLGNQSVFHNTEIPDGTDGAHFAPQSLRTGFLSVASVQITVANAGTSWCESNNAGTWVAVNGITGEVYRGEWTEPMPAAQFTSWPTTATLGGFGSLRKVKWNPVRNSWAIVGGSGPTNAQPRVWHSSDGNSWQRITEIENTILEEYTSGGRAIQSVAFADNGAAIYVGEGGIIANTASQIALRRGTYNVFFVSYFNTRAGRFVFDFNRQSIVLGQEFGNLITLAAQSQEALVANNAWLSAEVAEDLRLDVYVQFLSEGGDVDSQEKSLQDLTAQTTIRYAFTTEFPETGDGLVELERQLDVLPLGRQLTVDGGATTAVFEQSRTAIHNGRVWGMASQDEDRWSLEDGISPEIANQFNRFVLSYTETGWANLMNDQSYIPIQPTQSQSFTGILSTPSGLMVMFDNEVFLVNGDAAFGNLSVELYLDMVGCDAGTSPCKLGGLPFTIWDGKVWLLQAGQATEISRDQWLREDPFVRIVPEPQTRSILALTEAGRVLRYVVDDQFWLTDAVTRDGEAVTEMLPAPAEETGTRFVRSNGEVWVTRRDGDPDSPHVVFRDLDFGAPERRTPLYVVKVGTQGPMAQLEYDRDAGGYDAAVLPALFYTAGASTNGDTFETIDPQAGGIPPIMQEIGNRNVGIISWRLPLRSTRSFTIDARLELRGMSYLDSLKLPLRFVFAAGGELR